MDVGSLERSSPRSGRERGKRRSQKSVKRNRAVYPAEEPAVRGGGGGAAFDVRAVGSLSRLRAAGPPRSRSPSSSRRRTRAGRSRAEQRTSDKHVPIYGRGYADGARPEAGKRAPPPAFLDRRRRRDGDVGGLGPSAWRVRRAPLRRGRSRSSATRTRPRGRGASRLTVKSAFPSTSRARRRSRKTVRSNGWAIACWRRTSPRSGVQAARPSAGVSAVEFDAPAVARAAKRAMQGAALDQAARFGLELLRPRKRARESARARRRGIR